MDGKKKVDCEEKGRGVEDKREKTWLYTLCILFSFFIFSSSPLSSPSLPGRSTIFPFFTQIMHHITSAKEACYLLLHHMHSHTLGQKKRENPRQKIISRLNKNKKVCSFFPLFSPFPLVIFPSDFFSLIFLFSGPHSLLTSYIWVHVYSKKRKKRRK